MLKPVQYALQIINGYANGMCRYRELNDKDLYCVSLLANFLPAIYGEFRECLRKLTSLKLIDAFLELNDIFHTIITTFLIFLLPNCVTKSKCIWYFVFFSSGVFSPVKHGRRYIKYGCIKTLNLCRANDHNCINNI